MVVKGPIKNEQCNPTHTSIKQIWITSIIAILLPFIIIVFAQLFPVLCLDGFENGISHIY